MPKTEQTLGNETGWRAGLWIPSQARLECPAKRPVQQLGFLGWEAFWGTGRGGAKYQDYLFPIEGLGMRRDVSVSGGQAAGRSLLGQQFSPSVACSHLGPAVFFPAASPLGLSRRGQGHRGKPNE